MNIQHWLNLIWWASNSRLRQSYWWFVSSNYFPAISRSWMNCPLGLVAKTILRCKVQWICCKNCKSAVAKTDNSNRRWRGFNYDRDNWHDQQKSIGNEIRSMELLRNQHEFGEFDAISKWASQHGWTGIGKISNHSTRCHQFHSSTGIIEAVPISSRRPNGLRAIGGLDSKSMSTKSVLMVIAKLHWSALKHHYPRTVSWEKKEEAFRLIAILLSIYQVHLY